MGHMSLNVHYLIEVSPHSRGEGRHQKAAAVLCDPDPVAGHAKEDEDRNSDKDCCDD